MDYLNTLSSSAPSYTNREQQRAMAPRHHLNEESPVPPSSIARSPQLDPNIFSYIREEESEDECDLDRITPSLPMQGSRLDMSQQQKSSFVGPESAPSSLNMPSSQAHTRSRTSAGGASDERSIAWLRDRSKKDSHNRIERKRRDYINHRIAELGELLPQNMFKEGYVCFSV
ncbi:hypothetical protein Ciccas_004383 [Cichlidogyrus casuarinus]|uniref:BHLH domain-containing protein n=1 Tax=Cichlidogyrus casuarinus TaxID=1844966 RepID=A0ABD2QBM8_9PLAT